MKHIRTLEEWRDIKGYEGLYQVSDLGRVRSLDRLSTNGNRLKGQILKPATNKGGYLQVSLRKDGKTRSFLAHRLVAEAFCPNPDNLPFVNHCNERKNDNKAFNLDWISFDENINYGTRNERISKAHGKRVRCIETGIVYYSAREAARQLGIDSSTISKVCRGIKRTCGGFHWEYIEVSDNA